MSTIRLYLKANEKIFINGAVLQVDRKVAFDLLNDATFLLENHVMQKEQADTPLKQLYFVVQLMMMHPSDRENTYKMFSGMIENLLENLETVDLISGVKDVDVDVRTGKEFNALKTLRNLFPIEEEILNKPKPVPHINDGNIHAPAPSATMLLSQA
ncbi:MAG: flagellar biosynthesis repressor FlbT [Pseudomonadota bacterium]